jgi:carbon storage regulator
MLVLTRKIGQQIVIDGNIIVTIVAIDGNRIRVGVQAPKDISVDRAEVHQWKREVPDAEYRSAGAAVLV